MNRNPSTVILLATALLAFLCGGMIVAILVSLAQTPLGCSTGTNAECARQWLEAIGGWAGATVALPSLWLLSKQTRSMRQQSQYPALVRQLDHLKSEAKLSDDLTEEFAQIVGEYFLFFEKVNNANSVAEIARLTAQFKNRIYEAFGKAFLGVTQAEIAHSHDVLDPLRRKCARDIHNLRFRVPPFHAELDATESAQLSDLQRAKHQAMADFHGISELTLESSFVESCRAWRLAIAGAMKAKSAEIDAGLHH